MGTWGHKPLENDEALDLQGDFSDTKNISVLEQALDIVGSLSDDDHLEAPDAQQAIAAAQLVKDIPDDQIDEGNKSRLLEKSNKALKRILENSELNELWSESQEYDEWAQSVRGLLQ